jgi:hypothetical protein
MFALRRIVRTAPTPLLRALMNGLPRGIKPHTHNTRAHQHQSPIQQRQAHFPPSLPPPASIHMQPKHPGQTIRKPACEKRRDQGKEIVEVRNRLGDDKCDEPEGYGDKHPASDAEEGFAVHVLCAPEEADVDVF